MVAIEDRPQRPNQVIAIGEVKATAKLVDEHELARLDHLRTLIPASVAPSPPRLLLFSRSGFTAAVRRAAETRPDLELVGLDRLYHGG